MSTLNIVESIFIAALEKATLEARAAYLAEACKGDANLHRCVDRLLNAHARADSILPAQAPGLPAASAPPLIEEHPGSVIGPYKLLQQLGEGGFGVVFMAEQEQPVRRKVALKIIKPGMDSRQVVARFEAERQALALMDHPNIARVLDGGMTELGRPYFVMELVKGTPITEFCDKNRLTPRERLELFIPVCQAVQHAHQKGIIHRDIKPSNVLVTMYDDKPVPKVIDFGVAKAIEQKLTDHTLFTRVGQIIGTLEYMSPEQASLNALDVDTRADIYSLGVLLYELLTGTTPLNKDRLQDVAFLEMLRLIREEEPPRPSTRLTESGDSLTAFAVDRKTDTQKLPKLVKGELDWIAMKALEKDRMRRYDTANALAADVRRYLNDEQVEACPPTLGYRVQKYVHKHKTFISTMSTVAALLLIGIVTTSWQAVRATRAEGQAVTELDNAEAARKREAEQRTIAVAAAAQAEAGKRKAEEAGDEARRLAKQEKAAREQAEENARAAKYQALRAGTARHAMELSVAQLAWERNDLVEAERILAGAADEFQQSWEQRYLRELCRRKAVPLLGHTGTITGVAISADGKLVASSSTDKTVKIWDAAAGKVLFTLTGHEGTVNAVAMSADSKRVVSGSDDGTVMVWDAATGKRTRTLKGHAVVMQMVRVPKDGTIALKFEDLLKENTVRKEVPKGVLHVAISGDGERIVSGGADKTVKVWDGSADKATHTLAGTGGSVAGVTISPDGERIVTSQGPAGGGGGPGDRASDDLKLWDAKTGQELPFKQPGSRLSRFAVSPNGQRVAIGTPVFGGSGDVEVWDTVKGQKTLRLSMGSLSSLTTTSSLAFSGDGQRIVAAGGEGWVKVWNAEKGQELFALKGHAGVEIAGSQIAVSADGQRIVSALASDMRVWDLATKPEKLAAEFKGPSEKRSLITSLAISKRGMITGCGFRWVKAWDAATAQEIFSLSQPTKHMDSLALSGDGKLLVTVGARDYLGKDLRVAVWDAATGKPMRSSEGHRFDFSGSTKCAFTADGKHIVLAHSGDGTVKVLDAATCEGNHTIVGDKGASQSSERAVSIAISPDGQYVVRGGAGGSLTVLDVPTGQAKLTIKNAGDVGRLTYSLDGRHILGATRDGVVKVWDTEEGAEKLTLKGHGANVLCIAMSPDGQRIASSGKDGTIRLWDAATGQSKLILKGHASSLAFSPDGQLLVGACLDGMLRVWQAPADKARPHEGT